MGDDDNLGFYLCHGDTAAVRRIEWPGGHSERKAAARWESATHWASGGNSLSMQRGRRGKIRRTRGEGALMKIRLHGVIVPLSEELVKESLKNG
jgi:hypothetical protein